MDSMDSLVDDETIAEFKEAFELLDEAHKGSLDKKDCKAAFKKYGIRVAEDTLDEAFKEADMDKDGKIEFSEFYSAMTRKMRKAQTEDKVHNAFLSFDPEKRGFIPRQVSFPFFIPFNRSCKRR
jgi:Ca2+-binding EF-hand superfamily protein